MKKKFSRLREKRKPDIWTDEGHHVVSVINAFYKPWLNEFVIAAAYAQGINYDYDRPMYLNFGILGSTIGHEIMHGFDNSGRKWDKNGKMNII